MCEHRARSCRILFRGRPGASTRLAFPQLISMADRPAPSRTPADRTSNETGSNGPLGREDLTTAVLA